MNGLEAVGANPRLYFRLFTRYEGAIAGGHEEFFYALASLVGPEHAGDVIIHALPEGTSIDGGRTSVITIEGPAQALLGNETLLYYLTTGTRAMTLAETYSQYAHCLIFMGARDQSEEEQAIYARSFGIYGIPTTIREWTDTPVGTMSHSQISAAAAYRLDDDIEKLIAAATDNPRVAATIRATIVFAKGNPGVPVYVLGDYATRSTGCFETFRATYSVCKELGIVVKGGRIDISKADLDDKSIVDKTLEAELEEELRTEAIFNGPREEIHEFAEKHGTTVEALDEHHSMIREIASRRFRGVSRYVIRKTRQLLDEAGMEDFELIVSSGMKLDDIDWYLKDGATKVGIGEDAVYFLNKGQCNYTSDAVGYFENGRLVPFAKEGRELSRLVDEDLLAQAGEGFKIDPRMVRVDLTRYL